MRLLPAFALLLASLPGFAAGPPTFGPEFTFTHPSLEAAARPAERGGRWLIETVESVEMQNRMVDVIRAKCEQTGDCRVRITSGTRRSDLNRFNFDYRVEFNDGGWFVISLDPGVIEVQGMPLTLQQLQENESRIQDYIFDSAAAVDLRPSPRTGMGHLNIGAESAGFYENPRLLRDFAVDFANHPALAMGALENDPVNAMAVTQMGFWQRRRFARVIREFDVSPNQRADELAKKIYTALSIYKFTPSIEINHAEGAVMMYLWSSSHLGQALNLSRMARQSGMERSRVEIRSIRAQRNAHDFYLLAQLFEKRLAYLAALPAPVPFLNVRSPSTPREIVQQFYDYVTQSGLEWEPYRDLLPAHLARITPDGYDEPSLCERAVLP